MFEWSGLGWKKNLIGLQSEMQWPQLNKVEFNKLVVVKTTLSKQLQTHVVVKKGV